MLVLTIQKCISVASGPGLTEGWMSLPDGVAPEDAILVAFRGRLPLDHDGLVGPAAGDDVLRRSARRLLW